MDSVKKASMPKSLLWSFLEQGGSKAIAMVVQIILARLLSPEAFGTLAILLVVTQLADAMAQSGLGMALIQREDADASSYTTAWWLSLTLAGVMYAAVFAVAPAVETFYAMDGLSGSLRVLGLVVFANSANSIQRSYLQRSMDFRSIFRASTVAALLSGVMGVGLALLGCGVWALVAQALSLSVFTCVFMWVQVGWRPSFSFDFGQAHELFDYGWKICATSVLNVFYQGVSELILGRTTSAGDLGLYSQGRKYPAAAIGVMNNAIANVLFPSFSEVKSNREVMGRRIRESLSLGTFVVAPVSLFLAAAAEPLVSILLTDKWAACVPIFQLTCVSSSLLMFQLVNLRAYMALGDSGLYMRLQIVKVLGGGIVIWITAALSRDIYATAWATFIVGVLSMTCVDMHPAKRMHGYGALAQLRDHLPVVVLAGVASVASVFLTAPLSGPWAQLVAQAVIFCFVYLGGAKLLHFPQLSRVVEILGSLFRGGRS